MVHGRLPNSACFLGSADQSHLRQSQQIHFCRLATKPHEQVEHPWFQRLPVCASLGTHKRDLGQAPAAISSQQQLGSSGHFEPTASQGQARLAISIHVRLGAISSHVRLWETSAGAMFSSKAAAPCKAQLSDHRSRSSQQPPALEKERWNQS